MHKSLSKSCLAVCLALACWASAPIARAQDAASAISTVSALPLASVVVGASAAGAVVALPLALSATGALVVVEVAASAARGTVYVLERASDGARASIELAGRGAGQVSLASGTVMAVTVLASGVLLSAAGEVICFIPNALGQALLHDERVVR